ncbi:MAG TPA: outer membrane beta-barrel family protein, partial [Bacteroidia bacterium]|nr:outer membrane beta-barrel family protein [Bacteroidia bacterium]
TNELTNSSFSSNQTSGGILTSQTHLAKLGLDYDLNSRNSFSFSGLFNTDLISDTDHVVYSWLDMNQNLTRYSHRDMFGRNTDLGYDLDASYRHLFSKPDHLFTAELSASGNANRAIDSIYQLDYNPNGTFASPYPVLQQTNNNWKYQTAFARADFELPLDHTSKLETGAKVSMRWADDDLQSRSFNYPLGAYANDTGISNRFVYREQVYAAYVIYSQVVGKLNAQLGLRGEDAERSSTLYNTPTVYTHHSLDLFPSGFIGYKSASDAEWRLSYSRRINRPSVRYLNPFPDYTDVLNLRYGNPDLNPEYVDVVELSWMKYLKTGSISASAYYRHTSGVIQIYRSLADTVTGATVSTYRNLSSSDMGGVEVTTRVDLYKWWSLIGNGNVYEVQFVNTDPALPISQTGYAGYLKFSSRINFSSTTSFQFSGTYYFPVPSAQGIMHAYEYLDAGLRQELLHGKASLNLSLADLFNTQQSQITTHASRFTQEYLKKKESRIATITFTYRFGKQGEPKKPKAEELPSAQPEVE